MIEIDKGEPSPIKGVILTKEEHKKIKKEEEILEKLEGLIFSDSKKDSIYTRKR